MKRSRSFWHLKLTAISGRNTKEWPTCAITTQLNAAKSNSRKKSFVGSHDSQTDDEFHFHLRPRLRL